MFRLLPVALLCAGCSTITYQHGSTRITDTTFALTRQVGHIEIQDETGHAIVDQAQTDEVQAIQAAVQGTIQGLAAGAGKAVAP